MTPNNSQSTGCGKLPVSHYLIVFLALGIILASVQALKGRPAEYAVEFGIFWALISTGVMFIASFFRPRDRLCGTCTETQPGVLSRQDDR